MKQVAFRIPKETDIFEITPIQKNAFSANILCDEVDAIAINDIVKADSHVGIALILLWEWKK